MHEREMRLNNDGRRFMVESHDGREMDIYIELHMVYAWFTHGCTCTFPGWWVNHEVITVDRDGDATMYYG